MITATNVVFQGQPSDSGLEAFVRQRCEDISEHAALRNADWSIDVQHLNEPRREAVVHVQVRLVDGDLVDVVERHEDAKVAISAALARVFQDRICRCSSLPPPVG